VRIFFLKNNKRSGTIIRNPRVKVHECALCNMSRLETLLCRFLHILRRTSHYVVFDSHIPTIIECTIDVKVFFHLFLALPLCRVCIGVPFCLMKRLSPRKDTKLEDTIHRHCWLLYKSGTNIPAILFPLWITSHYCTLIELVSRTFILLTVLQTSSEVEKNSLSISYLWNLPLESS